MWRGGWRRWPRGAVVLLLVAAGCWWVRVEARSIPVPRAVLVDPAREVSGTIEYVAGGGVLGVWIYPERAGERVPRVGLTLRSGGAVVPAEGGGSSSSRDLAAQYWPPVGRCG